MAINFSDLVGGGSWPPELFSPQPNPIQGGASAAHTAVQVATGVDISSTLTQVWSYNVPAGAAAVMLTGRLRNLNTAANVLDFEVVIDGEVVYYDPGTTTTLADYFLFGSSSPALPNANTPFKVKSNITIRANKAASTSVNFEAAWYLIKA